MRLIMLSLDSLKFVWHSTLIEVWQEEGCAAGFRYRATFTPTGDLRVSHYYTSQNEAIAAAKMQAFFFEIDDADTPCGLVCLKTDRILRLSFMACDYLGILEGQYLHGLFKDLENFLFFKQKLSNFGRCQTRISSAPIIAKVIPDLTLYRFVLNLE